MGKHEAPHGAVSGNAKHQPKHADRHDPKHRDHQDRHAKDVGHTPKHGKGK